MNGKRKLGYDYRRLKHIKSRYLLIAAIFFLVLGIFGMRQNYSRMVELRTAVFVADEQNTDVETPLRDLRQFVHSHMNTNLSSGNAAITPPIQLKYRYERLVAAEADRVKVVNDGVKRKGEEVCAAQYPEATRNSPRVACVAEYLRVNSVQETSVPAELYKFDFVSPTWSPDLAGISLLLSLICFSALIAKATLSFGYKRMLD